MSVALHGCIMRLSLFLFMPRITDLLFSTTVLFESRITRSATPVLVPVKRFRVLPRLKDTNHNLDGRLDAHFSFFCTLHSRARPSVRDIFANRSFIRLWRCYSIIIEGAS